MRFPARLLPHEVTVKPLIGQGSYGPIFGDPFALRCRVEHTRRMVRDAAGVEVTAEATIYARPGAADVALGSQVTLPDGITRDVIAVAPHTGRTEVELVELNLA